MRTTYGRIVRIALPETRFEELEEERKRYERLVSEYDATALRLGELRAKLEEAREQHLEKRADALSNGTKEPSDTPVRKLAEEVADAEERLQVIEVALDRAGNGIRELVAAKKSGWLDEQEKVIAERRVALREAVEQWAQARAELAEEIGFANWLHRFEQKPMAGPSSVPKPFTAGSGPDDRPLGHEEIVALLLADVDPPQPTRQLFVDEQVA
jgi:hypothetical protein